MATKLATQDSPMDMTKRNKDFESFPVTLGQMNDVAMFNDLRKRLDTFSEAFFMPIDAMPGQTP